MLLVSREVLIFITIQKLNFKISKCTDHVYNTHKAVMDDSLVSQCMSVTTLFTQQSLRNVNLCLSIQLPLSCQSYQKTFELQLRTSFKQFKRGRVDGKILRQVGKIKGNMEKLLKKSKFSRITGKKIEAKELQFNKLIALFNNH